MKLAELVTTSQRMAATRSRLEKQEALADLLGRAAADEVPILVSYLSGRTRQEALGIGYATLGPLWSVGAAPVPVLSLADVDGAFADLESISGAGSAVRRVEFLRELFRRATEDEKDFLRRLLVGELRQGSLEGIMVDGVARAPDVPPAAVRRAFMLSGDLSSVAPVALAEGERGLSRFRIELFRPVRPMLAQTAEDVAGALETL